MGVQQFSSGCSDIPVPCTRAGIPFLCDVAAACKIAASGDIFLLLKERKQVFTANMKWTLLIFAALVASLAYVSKPYLDYGPPLEAEAFKSKYGPTAGKQSVSYTLSPSPFG